MPTVPSVVLSSPTRRTVGGPGRPLVVIGQRINPTGRPGLGRDLARGDLEGVGWEAGDQVAAGAAALDVNGWLPGTDEADLLCRLVAAVGAATDAPLVLDSADPDVLLTALEACPGRPLINAVNALSWRRAAGDRLLAATAERGSAVVLSPLDERGPSPDPADRLAVARRLLDRAADHGLGPDQVLVDPLVEPVATTPGGGRRALETLRRLSGELGVATVAGIGNAGYGSPHRAVVEADFLARAVTAGLTAAIVDPALLVASRPGGAGHPS
ncbi:MAG: dihydropteroate synthase [Acidimicrobiales bacterium]